MRVFAKRAMKNERDTLKMPPSECFIVVLSKKRLLFEGPLLVFFCLGQTTTKISNCWLVGWLVGWLVSWLIGWLVGYLFTCVVGWLVGLFVSGWLVGLVGWLVRWLVGWLVSCSAGSLVSCLVDWLVS